VRLLARGSTTETRVDEPCWPAPEEDEALAAVPSPEQDSSKAISLFQDGPTGTARNLEVKTLSRVPAVGFMPAVALLSFVAGQREPQTRQ